MIHTCVLVLVVLAAACDRAEAPPAVLPVPRIATLPRIVPARPAIPPHLAQPGDALDAPVDDAADATDAPDLIAGAAGDLEGDLVDDRDPCPDDPEDIDGIADHDGCPDAEAHEDCLGVQVDTEVLDVEDRCPDSAEVPEDGDGCPGEPMPITALRAM
jgi:hypothetical protein